MVMGLIVQYNVRLKSNTKLYEMSQTSWKFIFSKYFNRNSRYNHTYEIMGLI